MAISLDNIIIYKLYQYSTKALHRAKGRDLFAKDTRFYSDETLQQANILNKVFSRC